MEETGRYKFGDSESLADQTLELCGALDQLLEKYLDFMKKQLNVDDEDDYIDDETKELLDFMEEGIILTKHAEMLVINQSEVIERMDHKLNKIMKKLDDLELKV